MKTKRLFLQIVLLVCLSSYAWATSVQIGAVSSIPGFNTANAGADAPLTGVTVALDSPNVTCSNCMPAGAVGIGGMQITFSTGVRYTIATVTSRSAFTLTVNYTESNGTITATLHKFVHLRIYALDSFIPFGSSTVVQAGTPGSSAWYRRYGVSIVNNGSQNIAFFPQVDDLPATTDSSNPTARYYAALYTPSGGFIQSYPGCVDDWRLNHTITTTSWAQICTFNSMPPQPPSIPATFYTAAQIDARFPSCTVNRLIYYAATGNVQTCLTLDPSQFTITGGTLTVNNVLNRIQEEGVNLVQRPTLNFVGTSFTAADDAGNTRTNVTAATPLNNLASIAANGFYTITGSGSTSAVRTITGTTNQVSVANGDGSANPTLSLPTIVFLGTAGGSPAAGTLKGPDASGTNIAGANLILAGGPGTGTGAQGQLVAKYPLTGSSGTTLQSLSATAYPIQTNQFIDYTTITTVSNTTTETSLLGSGDDSSTKTIEAGMAKVGRTYRLTFRGRFDRTATPTLDVRLKLGSVTFNDYQPALSQMVGTASEWFLDVLVTITAVGAAGQAVMHVSKVEFQDGASGAQGVVLNSGRNRSVQTIDFTVAQTWALTVQWGTASASNAFTYSFGAIDIVR